MPSRKATSYTKCVRKFQKNKSRLIKLEKLRFGRQQASYIHQADTRHRAGPFNTVMSQKQIISRQKNTCPKVL